MKLSRRELLGSSLALGAAAGVGGLLPLSARPARAAMTAAQVDEAMAAHKGGSFVVSTWGGAYAEAQRHAWFAPFAEKYGVEVVEDGPPANPKIMAMVEVGNVTWDVCDFGSHKVHGLAEAGVLDKLDYDIIDSSKFPKGFVNDYGIANITFSTVVAYRTDVFSDPAPTTVLDLWNLEQFPGMRSLRDDPTTNITFGAYAAGVPKDQIYPLTEEKIKMAFAKLDEIKDHVIWWTSGAQAPQLLANKEVVMGTAWNGRLDKLREEGVPMAIVWNGAQLYSDSWAIPKGAPNKDLAMLFIAWASFAENNLQISNHITYGPVNTDAFDMVAPDRAPLMPTSYYDQQIICDYGWWGPNYPIMLERWHEWKIG